MAELGKLVIGLATVAIVLSVTFLILADVDSEIEATANNTVSHNASKEVITSMDDIPGWLPVVIIVVIGTLLIGLISRLGKN